MDMLFIFLIYIGTLAFLFGLFGYLVHRFYKETDDA